MGLRLFLDNFVLAGRQADRVRAVDGELRVFGGAITDEVVDALSAKVVCGAANNQLAHPGVDKHLMDAGITYAPDYVVNAGGLIQVADELDPRGFSFERAQQRASGILETTRRILALSDDERISPAVAADRIAEERIRSVGRLRSIWVG